MEPVILPSTTASIEPEVRACSEIKSEAAILVEALPSLSVEPVKEKFNALPVPIFALLASVKSR